MEIDEIDLHDDQRSGFLEKYLSGQISFDEWLKCYSGDPDKPSGDGENVLLDENEHPEFNETSDAISQKNAVVGEFEWKGGHKGLSELYIFMSPFVYNPDLIPCSLR